MDLGLARGADGVWAWWERRGHGIERAVGAGTLGSILFEDGCGLCNGGSRYFPTLKASEMHEAVSLDSCVRELTIADSFEGRYCLKVADPECGSIEKSDETFGT